MFTETKQMIHKSSMPSGQPDLVDHNNREIEELASKMRSQIYMPLSHTLVLPQQRQYLSDYPDSQPMSYSLPQPHNQQQPQYQHH